MPVYFHPQGEWSSLGKTATQLFAEDAERADVRVFSGASHAMLEFTLGFREQFPLRKKYYYFKDLDPHFTLAATALAKAGLQVTALPLSAAQDTDEFLKKVDREFGFVFYPLDHPVTGERFPFEKLEKALQEKSIPRLCATYDPLQTLPFVTLDRNRGLLVTFPNSATPSARPLSLLALGERLRTGAATAHALTPSTRVDLQGAHEWWQSRRSEQQDAERVRAFEEKRCAGAEPFFKDESSRRWDRSVLYWRDMDGHAFLSALATELGEPLKAPGCDGRFETTSLSRWGGIRTMDWLKSQGLEAEQVRGLVVISADVLKSDDFENKFVRAREKVLKDQNGH